MGAKASEATRHTPATRGNALRARQRLDTILRAIADDATQLRAKRVALVHSADIPPLATPPVAPRAATEVTSAGGPREAPAPEAWTLNGAPLYAPTFSGLPLLGFDASTFVRVCIAFFLALLRGQCLLRIVFRLCTQDGRRGGREIQFYRSTGTENAVYSSTGTEKYSITVLFTIYYSVSKKSPNPF